MKQNIKVAITIFLVSIMQMSALGMSAAISDISAAFPSVPDITVQMILTLPSLFMCLFSIISGRLSSFVQKKHLITISAVLILCAGFGGLFFHNSIYILLCWAIVLGCGIGIFMPINTSLIAIHFTGEYREKMSGQQVAVATIGGVCLSAIAGFLVKTGWFHAYLIDLAIIPGLICAWLFLPTEDLKGKKAETGNHKTKNGDTVGTVKISGASWGYILIMFLMISMYNIIPSNLTMYITEKSMGDASLAGMVTSVFLLGGALAGFLYPAVSRVLKDRVLLLALAFIIGGSAILFFTDSLPLVLVSLIVAGTSVGFLMSQTVVGISEVESKQTVTFAVSLLMAANCLGQCIAPVFTGLSQMMFHSDATVYRYLVVVILGTAIWIFIAFLLRFINRGPTQDAA